MRAFALGASLFVLLLSAVLALAFEPAAPGFQFLVRAPWSSSYGITYSVGVDGLSLGLVVLTALLTPLSLLVSYRSIQDRVRGFLIAFLILETGLIGVFIALDLFLFYIFWELVLVPMYFIIGVWGHENRIYATTKFVLYTLFGSLLMLVGILGIAAAHAKETGVITFELARLYQTGLTPSWQGWIFLCLFFGFAIKIPLFPFHTWLPDAHVQAPAAGSVMLAGVLLKMGVYGFLRVALPILSQASLAAVPLLLGLGLIGVVYGAFVALAQDDMKRLVAYSSVAHLGFSVIGIFSLNLEGVSGGVLQMLNHGISTGALFLLLGILYERGHSYRISDYGGVAMRMPRFAAFFGIFAFSSMGLPGLNNFVGEFLSIFGLFKVNRAASVFALLGVVLAAWYMLKLYQRVFLGAPGVLTGRLRDLSGREIALLTPLVILVFWLGIYPETALGPIRPGAERLIDAVQGRFVMEGVL